MEWLKKAPTTVVVTVIVTCGLLVLALLAAFVLLTLQGADTTELRQWIQTLGTLFLFPLLGITTVASVSGARSSSRAEDQTNGHLTSLDAALAEKDREIAALRRQLGQH